MELILRKDREMDNTEMLNLDKIGILPIPDGRDSVDDELIQMWIKEAFRMAAKLDEKRLNQALTSGEKP